MPWMRVVENYSNNIFEYLDYHPVNEGRFWSSYGYESGLSPLLERWEGDMKRNGGVVAALKFTMYVPAPFWILIINAGLVWMRFKPEKGLSIVVTPSLLFSLVYGLISLSPLYKTYLIDVSRPRYLLGPGPTEVYPLPLGSFYLCLIGCICSIGLPCLIWLRNLIERIRTH